MNQSLLKEKRVTVLDLLDHILDEGMLLTGDITISVADVDLVYIGLKALLASIDTAYRAGGCAMAGAERANPMPAPCPESARPAEPDRAPPPARRHSPVPAPPSSVSYSDIGPGAEAEMEHLDDALPRRINADPESLDRGLAKLVLTLIELIRQLLERQALRRVENGTVTDDEIERLGDTFQKLQARMVDLKKVFGLEGEDLNLDLGPLGDLM